MDFLLGWLIGRSMLRYPRRRAAPGSALPLYGGALLVVAGVLVAYWDGPDRVDASGWLLAGFGAVCLVVGACMQHPERGP